MIYGNGDSDRAQDRRGNEREIEEMEEVTSAILYTCARLLKLQFLGRLNVGFWNTVPIRQIETTFFDPASEFLSSHR